MTEQTKIERNWETITLSPEAQACTLRIFFGGSFDPPHIGHAQLPTQICAQLADARLVYVPAARSPHKDTKPTQDHHRVRMLQLALHDESLAEIWEQELEDAKLNPRQPSYWADTWSIIAQMNLPGTNRFLIGADQAHSMHRWHRYTEFWSDAMVMLRDQSNSIDRLVEQLQTAGVWTSAQIEHWRSQVVVLDPIDASSTSIRSRLNNPVTRTPTLDGLDERVYAYILEHNLYR